MNKALFVHELTSCNHIYTKTCIMRPCVYFCVTAGQSGLKVSQCPHTWLGLQSSYTIIIYINHCTKFKSRHATESVNVRTYYNKGRPILNNELDSYCQLNYI